MVSDCQIQFKLLFFFKSPLLSFMTDNLGCELQISRCLTHWPLNRPSLTKSLVPLVTSSALTVLDNFDNCLVQGDEMIQAIPKLARFSQTDQRKTQKTV